MQVFRLAKFFCKYDFVHTDNYLSNLENPEGRKRIMYQAVVLLSAQLRRTFVRCVRYSAVAKYSSFF
jgi:hypothetical protein